MAFIRDTFSLFTTTVNSTLEGQSPSAILACYLLVEHGPAFALSAYRLIRYWDTQKVMEATKQAVVDNALRYAVRTPVVGAWVEKRVKGELTEMLIPLKEELDEEEKLLPFPAIESMPEKGRSPKEILARLDNLTRHYDAKTHSGNMYTQYPPELEEMLGEIRKRTALVNPLHSDVYPEIRRMENENIAMMRELFHGDENVYGVTTHGGTSSILEMCLACIQYSCEFYKKKREEIYIIIPVTAHPAFYKAAAFGVNIKTVPVTKDGTVDVAAMEAAINEVGAKNVAVMVGSAPNFPHGKIDPIEELGKLAIKYDIPLDVDCCLGNFTTREQFTGKPMPRCDFAVPGVKFMSVDTHKHPEVEKGASMLLIRAADTLFDRHCVQSFLNTPSGFYVTPTLMDGSRSATPIVLINAIFQYYGRVGYRDHIQKTLATAQEITQELKKIDGIVLPYETDLTVVYVETSPGINPLLVQQVFEEGVENHRKKVDAKLQGKKPEKIDKQWHVSTVLATDGNPKPTGFHFAVTYIHTTSPDIAKRMAKDLAAAVEYVRQHPNEKPSGLAKSYGVMATGYVTPLMQRIIGHKYQLIQNSSLSQSKIPGLLWQKPEGPATKTENTSGSGMEISSQKKLV